MTYSDHYRAEAMLPASAEQVFAYLDDPRRLVGHMSKRSWMMAGGKMSIDVDAAGGRAPGSLIRLYGHMLGLTLSVEERVIERQAPRRKVWQTEGPTRLLVLTHYRMGFDIGSRGAATQLAVWIDFSKPEAGVWAWLSRRLGPWYARWCVDRMLVDAKRQFASSARGSEASAS